MSLYATLPQIFILFLFMKPIHRFLFSRVTEWEQNENLLITSSRAVKRVVLQIYLQAVEMSAASIAVEPIQGKRLP